MEAARNRLVLTRGDRLQILSQVIGAEVLEQFLQNKFVGDKRFSLEGAREPDPDARSADRARRALGVIETVIGMAHRGRLNVLANVLQQAGRGDLRRVRGQSTPNDRRAAAT